MCQPWEGRISGFPLLTPSGAETAVLRTESRDKLPKNDEVRSNQGRWSDDSGRNSGVGVS